MADMSQIYGNSPFMNELALGQMSNTQIPFQPGYTPQNVSEEIQKGVEAALKSNQKFQVPFKNPDMPPAEPNAVRNNQISYLDKQIQEKEAQITLIGQKINELKQSITGIKSKYAPKDNISLDELERKMAANRARRIKKDNESTEMWRWKREQDEKKRVADMQYNWQKEQNGIEDNLAQMTARNEFNGSLNAALQQWQTAKKSGDAIAEAYAKEHVDQLITYGQAKFGIDYTSKIKQAEGLAKQNAEADAEKKAREDAHTQHIAGIENQILYLKDDKGRLALQAQIQNDSELSESEKRDLLKSEGLLTVAQRKKKAQDGSKVDGAGKSTADAIAASKLTLDELLTKTTLNQYEETELDNKYTSAMRKTDVDKYKQMDKTDRKIWAKQNPGKFSFLQKKGLI